MRKATGVEPPSSATMRTETGDTPAARPPVAVVVLALSCDRPRQGSHAFVMPATLQIGRGDSLALSGEQLTVPDSRMSSRHAVIESTATGHELVDLGSTNGSRVNGVLVEGRAGLGDGDVIECGRSFFVFRLATSNAVAALSPSRPVLVRTASAAFADRLARLARIAQSGLPVLLRGETGTGKEVVSRAIHAHSGRPGPFVAVNCGALPASLVEAQLFGHVKGAFTGALRDSRGFVRAAQFGTLLLDEIGELPAASQVALLRVLEQGEVVPVGSVQAEPIDVRIISATHQPLEQAMREGRFRPDLFARLAGFVEELPRLVDRREDLGLLVAALLDRHGAPASLRLSTEVGRALFAHPFPLNVRELDHCIAAAVTLLEGDTLGIEALPRTVADSLQPAPDAVVVAPSSGRSPVALATPAARPSAGPATTRSPAAPRPPVAPELLSDADRALRESLLAHLASAGGNVTEVARRMGKARYQIQRWMRRFALSPDDWRGRAG